MILGLTALVCPIPVHRQIIKIDAPIALGLAVLQPLFLLDHTLGRMQGVLLFSGIVACIWMSDVLGRKAKTEDQSDVSVPSLSRHWGIDVASILGGLAVLVLGSRLLVDHSVFLTKALGVSEAVIGLTIVAAGTSLPQFATSLVAAIRRHPDIAIGNVVGSNIFNILAILGLASVVSPLLAPGILTSDYAAMIIFPALPIPLLYTGRLLHRLEGAVLFALYGFYLFTLWPK